MHSKPTFLLLSSGKHIPSICDWREPQAKIFEVFYRVKWLMRMHGLSLFWVFTSITFVVDRLRLNLLFIQKFLSMLINFWSSSANCTTSFTQCAEIKLECGQRQWIVSKCDTQTRELVHGKVCIADKSPCICRILKRMWIDQLTVKS